MTDTVKFIKQREILKGQFVSTNTTIALEFGTPPLGKPFLTIKSNDDIDDLNLLSWKKKHNKIQPIILKTFFSKLSREQHPKIVKKLGIIHTLHDILSLEKNGILCLNNKNDYIKITIFLNSLKNKITLVNEPPKNQILASRLQEINNNTNHAPAKSAHTTKLVHKKSKIKGKLNNLIYYLKEASQLGKITEIESANSSHYRAYLGHDRVPKTKTVFERIKKGKYARVGVLSKGLDGFQSFEDYLIEKYYNGKNNTNANTPYPNPLKQASVAKSFLQFISSKIDYSEFVTRGILDLLVASYTFEEADLHWGNWGVLKNNQNKTARIDFDQSMWSLTSKFVGFATDVKYDNLNETPQDAFLITKKDIENFPKITDAKPNNWIFVWFLENEANDAGIDPNVFMDKFYTDIKTHPAFNQLKWKAFLKVSLMPDTLLKNIQNNNIGKAKTADKYANHMRARLNELRMTLSQIDGFRNFVDTTGEEALAEILKEFNQYNLKIKEENKALRYDLDNVCNLFYQQKFIAIRQAIQLLPPLITKQYSNTLDKIEQSLIGINGKVTQGTIALFLADVKQQVNALKQVVLSPLSIQYLPQKRPLSSPKEKHLSIPNSKIEKLHCHLKALKQKNIEKLQGIVGNEVFNAKISEIEMDYDVVKGKDPEQQLTVCIQLAKLLSDCIDKMQANPYVPIDLSIFPEFNGQVSNFYNRINTLKKYIAHKNIEWKLSRLISDTTTCSVKTLLTQLNNSLLKNIPDEFNAINTFINHLYEYDQDNTIENFENLIKTDKSWFFQAVNTAFNVFTTLQYNQFIETALKNRDTTELENSLIFQAYLVKNPEAITCNIVMVSYQQLLYRIYKKKLSALSLSMESALNTRSDGWDIDVLRTLTGNMQQILQQTDDPIKQHFLIQELQLRIHLTKQNVCFKTIKQSILDSRMALPIEKATILLQKTIQAQTQTEIELVRRDVVNAKLIHTIQQLDNQSPLKEPAQQLLDDIEKLKLTTKINLSLITTAQEILNALIQAPKNIERQEKCIKMAKQLDKNNQLKRAGSIMLLLAGIAITMSCIALIGLLSLSMTAAFIGLLVPVTAYSATIAIIGATLSGSCFIGGAHLGFFAKTRIQRETNTLVLAAIMTPS